MSNAVNETVFLDLSAGRLDRLESAVQSAKMSDEEKEKAFGRVEIAATYGSAEEAIGSLRDAGKARLHDLECLVGALRRELQFAEEPAISAEDWRAVIRWRDDPRNEAAAELKRQDEKLAERRRELERQEEAMRKKKREIEAEIDQIEGEIQEIRRRRLEMG
jgi:chromosome segregation ATPase